MLMYKTNVNVLTIIEQVYVVSFTRISEVDWNVEKRIVIMIIEK